MKACHHVTAGNASSLTTSLEMDISTYFIYIWRYKRLKLTDGRSNVNNASNVPQPRRHENVVPPEFVFVVGAVEKGDDEIGEDSSPLVSVILATPDCDVGMFFFCFFPEKTSNGGPANLLESQRIDFS